ncbi:MAG TPA: NAD(P)/FAD-dependent oxidoreductase, partial [Chitinophagaceae bacterium]|nr:NAD(P)/FAD-dependent oxidoreductase [Chitinophagaceae bacterium]
MEKKITLLGAGLVGSLLGILLQKRGYQVKILERRPDMRKQNISAGRSINLAMSVRGWAALEMAGLRNDIESIAIPMYGRQIHSTEGTQIFQAYGKNNEAIYSVSRGELNKKLMSLAEECGVEIRFNQRVDEVDLDTNQLQITDMLHQESHTRHEQDFLIAADGAFSSLRNAYVKTDRFNYSQFYIEHGYKELYIPPGNGNSFRMEKNALHIWPRKNFMLIALPNFDGSFTCTLFFPFEGKASFQSLQTPDQVEDFFRKEFHDTLDLIPDLKSDFFQNPSSSLVTVRCYPWVYKNKSMLIGDAAHAIVPFYGQGMNAGFEDCRIFTELLDGYKGDDWNELLLQYQQLRKRNGDAVAELALQNFIEMRDKVADPVFLERKRIEKQLGLLFPGQFNSVYEMVSFSH